MKNLINLLLIFISKLLILCFSAQLIDNCENQIIVTQYQNSLTNYLQPVCSECQTGFVVDFDFKSCINATSLPMVYYSYCKRLDRNRECDEALCTIQIDQNKLFIQENPQQYDPRCAKIDTVNKICLTPRFPYTLDISQNKIIHNVNNFCKIFDGTFCLQNYETFYQFGQNQQYFNLGNFQNVGLIDINVISFNSIKCINNFQYDQLAFGCIPLKFNCLQNDGRKCICSDGEAVDSTGSSCQPIQNCLIYGQAGQIQYCIQCKPGFTSSPFEQSIQNYCQLTTPIPPPAFNTTFLDMPKCQNGEQYNQQSLQILQQFFQNISGLISTNLTDPIYLHLLSSSVQFYSNPIYNQYRPAQSLQCEKIPSTTPIFPYCITYLAGLCIQCSSYLNYFVQVNNTLQNFSTDYQSFCNYSPINQCKVISIGNKCLVCNENYYLNQQGQCQPVLQSPCYFSNSLGQCLLCSSGYLFNQQKQCSSVPQYCLEYYFSQDENYQCKYCMKNYYRYKYSNIYSCNIDTNYQPCIDYINSGYCNQCQIGSISSGGGCSYSYGKNFCQQLDQNFNVCLQCFGNYQLINGICQFVSQKSSCSNYYYNVTLQINNYGQQNYTCSYKSSLNQCHFRNQNGFYLDYNYQQQKCQLSNQTTYCQRCFQSNCLDIQDQCQKGLGWSQLLKICLPQCLNDQLLVNQDYQICDYGQRCDILFIPSLKVYQCSDCSIVQQIQQCVKKQIICSSQQVYSQLKNDCMVYCGDGKIAQDQQSCQTTKICQDGLTWSNYYKKCVYLYCQNQMAAVDQPCSKSTITLAQYYANNNSTSSSNNSNNSTTNNSSSSGSTSSNNSSNTSSSQQSSSQSSSSSNQNSNNSSSSNNSSQTQNSTSQSNQADGFQKNQSINNNNSTQGNFTTNNNQENNQSSSQVYFIIQISLLSLIFLAFLIYVCWMKSNQNIQNLKFNQIEDKIQNFKYERINNNEVKKINSQTEQDQKKIYSDEEQNQQKQKSQEIHSIHTVHRVYESEMQEQNLKKIQMQQSHQQVDKNNIQLQTNINQLQINLQ
ncbi:MFS transporter (macronuclear) [Tetrahymena thermophila SB210]|uniref:MFS transporter n=1 Tax=Tetrahymena thermophila (strain SB210) TaxID=312017 RepID=Q24GJ5_TETTS|nr:MFS transporter [Tetrahymena thermophila SB210]EAS06876.2 MFS transporter [Tetrahymena thermophila SB210]|eukprot:XP_001027118.2 MFS transporter [Tetrahymena thermophila SB210]